MDNWSGAQTAELVRCTLSYFIFPQGAISPDAIQKDTEKRELKRKNFTRIAV